MPVYRYFCPTCEARFEARFTFQEDASSAACPRGHTGARRVFTAPTVVYKGSGFYVTDHRKPASSGGTASK